MFKTVVFICFVYGIMGFNKLISQNGELGSFDCTYAKEVIIPFNYSADTLVKINPLLDQKVFYSFRDQFTFWYRVLVKSDKIISFKIKPLNDSDAYSVYLYNYNQPDFCDKIYNQKISPVKSSFFIGKGSSIFNGETEKSFHAKKENIYYIGVLNTSLHNCGHKLKLFYNNDTLKVDALHMPCKRDFSNILAQAIKTSESKKNNAIKPIARVKKDSLKTHFKTEQNIISKKYQFTIATLNAKNKTPLESKIFINDKSTGNQIEISHPSKGEYTILLEKDKTYIVRSNLLGYTPQEIIIEANSIISQKKERQEILLDALKQGESFVLKSIYFVPNTYVLKTESKEELEKLLNFLKTNENTIIEIQGHTNGDNRIYKNKAYTSLSEDWNFSGSAKKLSKKRAEIIKTFMVNHGIDQSRLVAKGYGGRKALVKDPESNEDAQKNIRVEVAVLKG